MRTFITIPVFALALTACNGDDDMPMDSGHDHGDADTDTDADSDTDTDTDADTDVTTYDFLDPAGAFDRVDRAGMPAINTAVVTSKDEYNQADPVDDAALTFAVEIIGNLAALHSALDDDLTGAGLVPCTVVGDGTGTCVAVAGPLVIPDVVKIDTTVDAGFPNGRALQDPVMDVTLAVVLLELSDGTHSATDLVGLNPTANDVEFGQEFPYLAPPHE